MNQTRIARRSFLLGAAATLAAPAVHASPELPREIFEMTNEIRLEFGRNILLPSRKLTVAATRYADVLSRSDQFSHEVGGSHLTLRAKAVGYRFRFLAENIAWVEVRNSDVVVANRIISGWMNSPGHRRNILDRKPSELGVGVVQRGSRHYAVQVFGKRG